MPEPHPKIAWPHAPRHQLGARGTYFVTASTYRKAHYFRTSTRLDVLQRGLLAVTSCFGWEMEAWAIFSNHYHFVAHSPGEQEHAESLSSMLSELHAKTAGWINRIDGTMGRKVWHNFRDTRLTYQRSYLARLNYVHQNAVRHGIVPVANQYRWCSASWFERTASPAMVKSIYRFRLNAIQVGDDFAVVVPSSPEKL